MPSFSAKIVEAFRNLRSDAVPRDPRPQETLDDVTEENQDSETLKNETEPTNNEEEIFIGPENADKKKEKPKKVFNFGKGKKSDNSKPKNNDGKVYNVRTQATGSVITVLNSPDFHWGNSTVYNLGPASRAQHSNTHNDASEKFDGDEEIIEKNNEIILLMEAKISPEHEYIDYIAKNLGKNWHSIFRKMGYTKGRIETFEYDEERNGVAEARYKLLLDWMRNDEDGSLGKLASVLWAEGERQIVKELSLIYNTNYKNKVFC